LEKGPQILSAYTDLEDSEVTIEGYHLFEVPKSLLEVLVKSEMDMSNMVNDSFLPVLRGN